MGSHFDKSREDFQDCGEKPSSLKSKSLKVSKGLGIQKPEFPVEIFIKTTKAVKKMGVRRSSEDNFVTSLPGDLAYDVTPPLAAG